MPYIGNKYEIGDHNNSWKPLDDISSYVATFDGSATNAVSTTNNTIRVPEHRFIQGQRVTYLNGGGGNIGGLTSGTAYYVSFDTNNTLKLATSLVNANNNSVINLSAVGSGSSHTLTAAFDGVNKKFKITYSGGRSSRFTSATQLSIAINNILQRPNDTTTFTDGFRISDNEKIEFNVAPVAADIFWGSILSASLPTFDISDNKLDNFTGDGSTTDFTLSHIPVNNEGIIVTINGVIQHPTDKNGTRAYSLDASVLVFTAAPANGDEIQVRHIGFAGATSGNVTGFYGRTGNVTLSSSADNAIVGVITATKFSGPFVGTITGGNDIVAGIITANAADIDDWIDVGNNIQLGNAGVITATTFRGDGDFVELDVDGHTNLDNVSIAGVTTGTIINATTFVGNGDFVELDVDGHTNLDNVSVAGVSTFAGLVDINNSVNISSGLVVTSGATLDSAQVSDLTDNRVVIAGASGELEDSGNLTFNGSTLAVTGNQTLSGSLTAASATFSGNVSVGGTLTYEDVTNVDAVGVITARNGIRLGATGANTLITGDANGLDVDGKLRIDIATGGTVGSGNAEGIFLRNTQETDNNAVTIFGGADDYNAAASAINFVNVDHSANYGDISFDTRGSSGYGERLRIEYSGRIGINTTSSRVNGVHIYDKHLAINEGYPITWLQSNSSSSRGRMTVDSGGNYLFQFGSGNDEKLRFKSDGKVGINTASPAHHLDVVGNIRVHNTTPALYLTTNANTAESAVIRFGDTGSFQRGSIQYDFAGNSHLRFKMGGAGNNVERLVLEGSTGHITPGAAGTQDLGSTSKEFRNLYLGDDGSVYCGSDQDIRIFHSSGVNYFTSPTNKQLQLKGDGGLLIRGGGNQNIAQFTQANGVDLYHNQSLKLETSSTGISVTGEVAASQDYPTIRPTLDLNFAATKILDPRIEYYRYGPASYIDANGKVVLVGEDVPRFDHDPDTGECKGLLVEGERRNYIPNGVRPGDKWTGSKANSTWTENTTETTAPDGTYTATKWAFTGTDPYLYHQQTLNAGVTYTLSMWVKAGTNMSGDWVQFRMGAAPYSIQTNCIIPTDGSWRRITYTKTIGGSNETNVNVGFEPQTSPSGNPASGDVIYVWGAQLESGSTASSFIPTYGYTQARGPDVVQITGEEFSDFYNQIEGTIFLSASYDTDARAAAIVTIDDTSNAGEYTEVGYRAGGASSGQVSSYIRTTSGNDQYYKNWTSSATQGNEFKLVVGYKDDDYASSANGESAHTDTSGTTSRLYDRLRLSQVHTVNHGGVGHYRRLMYYSKRITNSQLVTLTS